MHVAHLGEVLYLPVFKDRLDFGHCTYIVFLLLSLYSISLLSYFEHLNMVLFTTLWRLEVEAFPMMPLFFCVK